jgi:hypothetical protein
MDTDDKNCSKHMDKDCTICPYYDYKVEIEDHIHEGRFWIGQEVHLRWGWYGDGVDLVPHRTK